MKKKVFISFDYENDKNYKFLLTAWSNNEFFEFEFEDYSSKEIKTKDIYVVKRALSRKINEANYTLVIIGVEGNKIHRHYKEIGYRNWQNYEIAKSKENGNKLIAVKINKSYSSPEELLSSNASWALSYQKENILKALLEA